MTNGSPGGLVWLRPGAARPHNLRSTRPDGVGQVTTSLKVLPSTFDAARGVVSITIP